MTELLGSPKDNNKQKKKRAGGGERQCEARIIFLGAARIENHCFRLNTQITHVVFPGLAQEAFPVQELMMYSGCVNDS